MTKARMEGVSGPARSHVWAALRAICGALVVAVVVVYLWNQRPALAVGIELHSGYLGPLAVLEIALLTIRGLIQRDLARIVGVELGIVEAASLTAWSSLANYVAPYVGGAGLRAAYLKRRHRLPVSFFASIQAATYSLHFMVASAVGATTLLALPGAGDRWRTTLFTGFGGIFLAALLVHRWPFPEPTGKGLVARTARQVLNGWRRIREARWSPLLFLLTINLLLQASAIACAFALFGLAIGPPAALFVAAVYSLSILVALTPASLGISEGAVAFSAGLVGLTAPVALAAAAARRGVTIVATALVAMAGSKFGRS